MTKDGIRPRLTGICLRKRRRRRRKLPRGLGYRHQGQKVPATMCWHGEWWARPGLRATRGQQGMETASQSGPD